MRDLAFLDVWRSSIVSLDLGWDLGSNLGWVRAMLSCALLGAAVQLILPVMRARYRHPNEDLLACLASAVLMVALLLVTQWAMPMLAVPEAAQLLCLGLAPLVLLAVAVVWYRSALGLMLRAWVADPVALRRIGADAERPLASALALAVGLTLLAALVAPEELASSTLPAVYLIALTALCAAIGLPAAFVGGPLVFLATFLLPFEASFALATFATCLLLATLASARAGRQLA